MQSTGLIKPRQKQHPFTRLFTKYCREGEEKLLWLGGRKLFKAARHPVTIMMAVWLVGALCFSGCAVLQTEREIDTALRNKITAIARDYKGSPYQWGGETPDGFDCSGYVQYLFKRAGIDVPRTCGQQYDAGRRVARSNLKKGDLVFFTRWKFLNFLFPPNHVGIYLGGNRFIHAPSSGKSVRIDSLHNCYWDSHYKGARDLF